MIAVMVDEGIPAEYVEQLASEESVRQAVECACHDLVQHGDVPMLEGEPEVCVRFASDAEVQQLNHTWRGQDKVTDVLSFPMQDGVIQWQESLGDMILAVPFVLQEAARLVRDAQAHQLHLVVHSLLHLLGYDHIDDDAALHMQMLECRIMRELGLHHPYPDISL